MSSSIRYIDDKNGNHVFPVTHERAVMDSDGVTLETKLGQKQDTISDLSTIRTGAAAGATAVQPAALDVKQDVISDLQTIRSGAALGSTSVQPVDIENMVEAEPIGSIIPPVNPSEFATKEEISQLGQELNGSVIKDYTGQQAVLVLPEVESDTIGKIEITGNTGDILHVRLLHIEGSTTTFLKEFTHDYENILTIIPATTNRIGIYEQSGKTLNITAKVTLGGLEQVVEYNKQELEQEILRGNIGLQTDVSLDDFNTTMQLLYNAVKYIGYYDPDDDSPMYIRLAGLYTSWIQFTLTKNHSSMIDFKVEGLSARPTGVQHHIMTVGSKVLYVVIDWDVFTTNYNDPTSLAFWIDNPLFKNTIYPLHKDLQEQIDIIKDASLGREEVIGWDESIAHNMQTGVQNTLVCPCPRISSAGLLKSIKVRSELTGTTNIYIGEVDQLYLFVARLTIPVDVVAGENEIDLSDREIYVKEGEQIAYRFLGSRYLVSGSGTPEGDNSFYYQDSASAGMQLGVYPVATRFVNFTFQYTVLSNDIFELKAQVSENTTEIASLKEEVSTLMPTQGIVQDRQGNKYRLIVTNGNVEALALNFSNVLCVGNSYTTHPTGDDAPSDLNNSLWWGHWAMAASAKEVAWTTLLQSALRQKNENAVVTPIFGRRVETGLRNVTDNDAFIYWENGTMKSLKPNLADFTGVDCVIFYIGDNYTSGSGWYDIFKPMVDQFIIWFPSATIICCSCRARVANNSDIAKVADETGSQYVSMVGINSRNKLGAFVLGDDNQLHQITASAVANHPGDYGQVETLSHVCDGIGYSNNAVVNGHTFNSIAGVTLTTGDTLHPAGAIVSVFAEVASGSSLSGLSVVDGDNNTLTVTDHGVTDYGRVFTFVMPSTPVTISAN